MTTISVLPNELLLKIFIQLSFGQKKECMLVSKHWRQIIFTNCLYHAIYIGTQNDGIGVSTLEKFIDIMEQNPFLQKQVRILFIEPLAYGLLDTEKFVTYFTNLRSVSYSYQRVAFKDYLADKFESDASETGIEYVYDAYDCALIRKLIENNLCFHISVAKLDLFDCLSGGWVMDDLTSIIQLLKNMPALRHLTLEVCPFYISDLGYLHSNITCLESITITCTCLYLDAEEFNNPAPEETVTTLSITLNYPDIDACIDLLDYIGRKYTHLERFFFHFPEEHVPFSRNAFIKEINNRVSRIKSKTQSKEK